MRVITEKSYSLTSCLRTFLLWLVWLSLHFQIADEFDDSISTFSNRYFVPNRNRNYLFINYKNVITPDNVCSPAGYHFLHIFHKFVIYLHFHSFVLSQSTFEYEWMDDGLFIIWFHIASICLMNVCRIFYSVKLGKLTGKLENWNENAY